MIEIEEKPQKAVLFGIDRPENSYWGDQPLEELSRLTETAGAEVVGRVVQRIKKVDPQTYIGRGKAEQIRDLLKSTESELAIFDDELAPSQARNLEEIFEVQVLDRTELILDIFARHASTTEARLQVELAQLEYLLPRLRRMWVHLSRIRGGIGLRGPGETQLETDRRLIQQRIADHRRRLEKLAEQRSLRRQGREELFSFALVGYTNAGKSSLMRELTGSEVLVRDQLFATLDTTTRLLELPESQPVLISDTVGFISRLPHHLVASFKATLEELLQADHLLVVVDVANPHFSERIQVVERVLHDIGAGQMPRTLVFNKTDLVQERHLIFEVAQDYPGAVFTSAVRGEAGYRHLREHLARVAAERQAVFSLKLDPGEGRLTAAFHRQGQVLELRVEDGRLNLRVRISRAQAERILAGTPYEGQLKEKEA